MILTNRIDISHSNSMMDQSMLWPMFYRVEKHVDGAMHFIYLPKHNANSTENVFDMN